LLQNLYDIDNSKEEAIYVLEIISDYLCDLEIINNLICVESVPKLRVNYLGHQYDIGYNNCSNKYRN